MDVETQQILKTLSGDKFAIECCVCGYGNLHEDAFIEEDGNPSVLDDYSCPSCNASWEYLDWNYQNG